MTYQFRQIFDREREDNLFFIQWKNHDRGHTKARTSGWTFNLNDMKKSFRLEIIL